MQVQFSELLKEQYRNILKDENILTFKIEITKQPMILLPLSPTEITQIPIAQLDKL